MGILRPEGIDGLREKIKTLFQVLNVIRNRLMGIVELPAGDNAEKIVLPPLRRTQHLGQLPSFAESRSKFSAIIARAREIFQEAELTESKIANLVSHLEQYFFQVNLVIGTHQDKWKANGSYKRDVMGDFDQSINEYERSQNLWQFMIRPVIEQLLESGYKVEANYLYRLHRILTLIPGGVVDPDFQEINWEQVLEGLDEEGLIIIKDCSVREVLDVINLCEKNEIDLDRLRIYFIEPATEAEFLAGGPELRAIFQTKAKKLKNQIFLVDDPDQIREIKSEEETIAVNISAPNLSNFDEIEIQPMEIDGQIRLILMPKYSATT